MPTLTEWKTLTTDNLIKGIIGTIIKVSPLMTHMPFKPIEGKADVYNLETALAQIDCISIDGVINTSNPQWEERTSPLKILIGDIDIPGFVQQTLSKDMDQRTAQTELKIKALAHKFENLALFGRTTTGSTENQFKGILRLIAECEGKTVTDLDAPNNPQVVAMDATSATITITKLDELIDAVKPKPDILVSSRAMRRKIQALSYATGSPLRVDRDDFGRMITHYGEYPFLINDFMTDNMPDNSSSVTNIATWDQSTTRGAGDDNTPIFALAFGEMDALTGIQNGGIVVEPVGIVQNKDAKRYRIKWYVGMSLYSTVKAAVLTGAKYD